MSKITHSAKCGKACDILWPRTTSFQLTETKISFAVKTIDLGSYLKVFTGIKEKK